MKPYDYQPMNTDEDIYAIINSTFRWSMRSSVMGIYKIFRAETPDAPVMDVWLRTLTHILAVLQRPAETEVSHD